MTQIVSIEVNFTHLILSSGKHINLSYLALTISQPAYLITRSTSGLDQLGVVAAAIQLPVTVEVDQIHQQLLARRAHEARRVPDPVLASTGRKHSDVTTHDDGLALETTKKDIISINLVYWDTDEVVLFYKIANRLEPGSGQTFVGPDLGSSLFAYRFSQGYS